MRKNLKARIGLTLAAIAATTGMVFAGSVPAQAITMTSLNHCNWPGKATFDLVGDSGSTKYTWKAYSPTGYLLGTYVGHSWATPWEDVSMWVFSLDNSYGIVKWCR